MDGIIKAHKTKILRNEDDSAKKEEQLNGTVLLPTNTSRVTSYTKPGYSTKIKLSTILSWQKTDLKQDMKSSLLHNQHRKQTEFSNLIWSLRIRTSHANCHGTLSTRHSPTCRERRLATCPGTGYPTAGIPNVWNTQRRNTQKRECHLII